MPPDLPRMLYGTAWKKEFTTPLVVSAVLAGFTGIDTATQPKHYAQKRVGEALKVLREEHGIERESLWLQSKFTGLEGQDLGKELPYDRSARLEDQVKQSFATALAELGTTYLDSLVLHSPMRTREQTLTVWREFEKFHEAGKVRLLGLSNIYDPEELKWAFETFKIKPAIIQNRFTREHNDFALPILRLCAAHSATFQSFWTLTGNGFVPHEPLITTLAKAQNLTNEQAWFKFLMQVPAGRFGGTTVISPLSGTTSEVHMKEDVEVMKRVLKEEQEDATWRTDETVQAERALMNALWGPE